MLKMESPAADRPKKIEPEAKRLDLFKVNRYIKTKQEKQETKGEVLTPKHENESRRIKLEVKAERDAESVAQPDDEPASPEEQERLMRFQLRLDKQGVFKAVKRPLMQLPIVDSEKKGRGRIGSLASPKRRRLDGNMTHLADSEASSNLFNRTLNKIRADYKPVSNFISERNVTNFVSDGLHPSIIKPSPRQRPVTEELNQLLSTRTTLNKQSTSLAGKKIASEASETDSSGSESIA